METSLGVAVSTLISAPNRAWTPPPDAPAGGTDPPGRPWGVFAPLYALRSDRDWGVGDLADLATLQRWTRIRGGAVVATLPLLATYLDTPFEPSPYRPVSRLFWNELFLDVESLLLSGPCPAAHALASSAAFQRELAELRATPMVDYRRVMALKRSVLEKLVRCFLAGPSSPERTAFEAFVRDRPELETYARFRAATEKKSADWREWPSASRHGPLESSDYDEQARLYHLFCQWQMEEQLGALPDQEGLVASAAGVPDRGASDAASAPAGRGHSLDAALPAQPPSGLTPGRAPGWFRYVALAVAFRRRSIWEVRPQMTSLLWAKTGTFSRYTPNGRVMTVIGTSRRACDSRCITQATCGWIT